MASNVDLTRDPNSVNINNNIVNGVHDYQDMYINAELTALRKGRTQISTGLGVSTEETLVANFMGSNQNTGTSDNMNYTTNYYCGSNNEGDTQYESFGIETINVKINSSYVPQVTIRFVDLRGLSFFNNDTSPYKILFDFPPPIFNLRIKGYYGGTLQYKLHLVKYDTEFDSANSNFIITANFIATTFAPLSDVLFRYVTNAPLIGKNINDILSIENEVPETTFDFILRLRELRTYVNDELKNTESLKTYDKLSLDTNAITRALIALSNYDEGILSTYGVPVMFTTEFDDSSNIPKQIGLNYLNKYILRIENYKQNQKETTIKERLYIGYVSYEKNNQYNKFNAVLSDYSKDLLSRTKSINSLKTKPKIGVPIELVVNNAPKKFIAIDVTEFYLILHNNLNYLNEEKNTISGEQILIMNNSITRILGMKPTIYNVFKLILGDTDTFFEQLQATAVAAEKHHKNYVSEIIKMSREVDQNEEKPTIYSFPLIIDNNERVSPKIIEEKIPEPFPELIFVGNFIDTFIDQSKVTEAYEMLGATNSNGSYKWFPISPIDCDIVSTDLRSPYASLYFSDLSGINAVMSVLLTRYYILTQYALPNKLTSDDNKFRERYTKLFADAEATNVLLGSPEPKILQALEIFANKYRNNIDGFYDSFLATEIPEYTELENEEYQIIGGNEIYINKENPAYRGVELYSETLAKQIISPESTNQLSIFVEATKKEWYMFFADDKIEESYEFTIQNTILITDLYSEGEPDKNNTRHIMYGFGNQGLRMFEEPVMKFFGIENTSSIEILEELLVSGNSNFNEITNFNRNNTRRIGNTGVFHDYIVVLSKSLSFNTFEHKTKLDEGGLFANILILSNFGTTVGMFNTTKPLSLNDRIFRTPSLVEIPRYLCAYVGSLIVAQREEANGNFSIMELLLFLNDNTYNNGHFVAADYYDSNNNLSSLDESFFVDEYTSFIDSSLFQTVRDSLTVLVTDILDSSTTTNSGYNRDYEEEFEKHLRDTIYNIAIVTPMIERQNIVIYGNNTFSFKNINNKYTPLLIANKDDNLKKTSDLFFKTFLNSLISKIGLKSDAIANEEVNEQKIKGDDDIINQTYYSFKNINDKWLTKPYQGTAKSFDITEYSPKGYPFKGNKDNLIDLFSFVDRAMNPAGDTMIDPDILLDMFDNPNASVYSVLGAILSKNHFNFYPLQNFMTDNWDDTFKIDVSDKVSAESAFICQYIGGSSNYPSNISGNGFTKDCIIDLGAMEANDFRTLDLESIDFETNNKNFDYGNVKAFSVKFGEQNQSMFKGIKINSKEFPETNESLKILSNIAGDQKLNAPTQKAQNLYSVYESRSYTAKVETVGNAMIQPTQYFQLENVPMFNGAYLILGVEHDIKPNMMSTSFEGVKILNFPIPRVTNPATAFPFPDRLKGVMGQTSGGGAVTMSKERLNQLKSVFGVDISHHNGILNWDSIMKNGDVDDPEIKFAFVKVSQGTGFVDEAANKNTINAKKHGIKIGYYHYVEEFNKFDVVQNATDQANHFMNTVGELPAPDFPLVMDIETHVIKNTKINNTLFMKTFMDVLNENGFKSIVYSGGWWLNPNANPVFSDYPFWFSRYVGTPEITDPILPNGYNNWDIWQFSSNGRLGGYSGVIDINVMTQTFFDKY
jgi:lysozyme